MLFLLLPFVAHTHCFVCLGVFLLAFIFKFELKNYKRKTNTHTHRTIISRCSCCLSVLRSLTLCPVLSPLSLSFTHTRGTVTHIRTRPPCRSAIVCVRWLRFCALTAAKRRPFCSYWYFLFALLSFVFRFSDTFFALQFTVYHCYCTALYLL